MRKRLLIAWTTLNFPDWTAPAALFAAVLLSFGLRLPALGLYWDDWPYLWFFHALGPAGMYNSLGADRPLLGVLYAATLQLLGSSPIAWQIFGLAMRWLCALGFWLALRLAWPARAQRGLVLWAALLFSVFPGFTQHWISVVWGNAYVLYAMLFFSLALTTWAAQNPRRRWPVLPLALALSAFTMFSTEYFYGLELLRPALAWLALTGLARPTRLRRAALIWAPFLTLMIAFALWRGFYHPFGGGGEQGLLSALFAAPLSFLADLPLRILRDAIQAFFGGWGLAFNLAPTIDSGGLAYAGLGLLVSLLAWVYLARFDARPPAAPTQAGRGWALEAALLGLLAFLAAGWPVWLTRLPFESTFPWDRFALVFSPGVCLITAALIDWLAQRPVQRALLVALLVGLSAGVQNTSAAVYRKDWNNLSDMLWQLSWRAPAIQPGTLLLADQIGLRYFEDDSLSGPINWTYFPDSSSTRLAYLFQNIPERLYTLGYLKSGVSVKKDFRAMSFAGNTSAAVVLRFNPPGCLQILDPRRDSQRSDLPEFALRALPLSRPELILSVPPAGRPAAAPPKEIFGPEPKHKWCYYYEQAALAAQAGRWDDVLALKSQSIGEGHFPADPAEYLPFVEAYLHRFAWDDARQLSRRAYDASAATAPAYCALWKRAASWSAKTEGYPAALRATRSELHCMD